MAGADPFDFELWAAEWSKPHWGNFDANVTFLDRTGLLGEPRKVLEIGAGQGVLLGHLMERGQDVIGCDQDLHLVPRWRRDLQLLVPVATRLPFPADAFDLVLSFDVFERIPDSDAHLREVRRVLRPGGHYLLRTPNKVTDVLIEPLVWARSSASSTPSPVSSRRHTALCILIGSGARVSRNTGLRHGISISRSSMTTSRKNSTVRSASSHQSSSRPVTPTGCRSLCAPTSMSWRPPPERSR